jgi:hypothetical protein
MDTPTLNRHVYEKDPDTNKLLNQGVAKVTSGLSESELQTLRFELTNFVCDGQYQEGLNRILRTYLTNLDQTEQPGVWVSGFYGSGKSHLVKMLQYLWTDFEFSDGAKARGLAKLPQDVTDNLKELSTQARRLGGIHAIAGELKYRAEKSVRLELLGLVFKSAGLPEDYARTSFIMWLRHEGIEQAVRAHVASTGRDFNLELNNLYVSDTMAKAILAAKPGFAHNTAEVKMLLESQFPEKSDVTDTDMIDKIKAVLAKDGKMPCTLIVLDEVQQYIGDSVDRSKDVQDLQEQCCARLGANVMFVATGQNALAGTPLLQRLQGRFPVAVELQDTDVEQVTREVVLKKKTSAKDTLENLLETHSGEIERHLAATKIAFTSRDRSLLIQDYPLLPVRRRFWERVLRAVDKAGTGAQLRTQLWIVYDAVQQTADLPLGNVVSGAFLFDSTIKTSMLRSGVLLQEISENIARQKQEPDGELRYQLCALIFLIGQLPHQGPADAGIRADAETLSDLLVTDLTTSSTELRKKVPELLETLAASGVVMQVENEYRMQTREGGEWNQSYQEAMNKFLGDPAKFGSERSQLLKTHCGKLLSKRKLIHGDSKEARTFDLHFGAEPPATGGATVPVWIRDGWEVEEKTVLADARAAGDAAAVVYGFIPRQQAEDLKQAVAGYYAATATLQAKGNPHTPEGIEARKAMETRQEQAQQKRDGIIHDILNNAAIYIAGGGDPVGGSLLTEKVEETALACLDRLYPQFYIADSPHWHKVIERSRKGDGDALAAVGHNGDPEAHPVCSAILNYVGSGKKGSEIRQHFADPDYGWPRDAVDAALFVLCNGGLLQAKSGSAALPKGKLDQKSITTTEFRVETITLSTVELIAIRGLFKDVGLTVQPGQESASVPEFLNRMRSRAIASGGAPPLPQWPSTTHLDDINNRIGNDQLKTIYSQINTLKKQAPEWRKQGELIAKREPRWRDLKSLFAHAEGLLVADQVRGETAAIESSRGLLADPDPVPGLIDQLTQALRTELNKAHSQCKQLQAVGRETLDASPIWNQLKPPQQETLKAEHQLDGVPAIAVGTTEEVLKTLQQAKLTEWKNLCDAIPTRFGQALQAAAKLLEPKAQAVKLLGATIKNEDDLKSWLTATEEKIREKLKDGPVILS